LNGERNIGPAAYFRRADLHYDGARIPRLSDKAKIEEAKGLGIPVLAWTVDSPADIARPLDLGVDGIVSDRPDLVREELKRRGMPLPAAMPVAH
jgi:glycerophosphoryl diester phosphodiesterase